MFYIFNDWLDDNAPVPLMVNNPHSMPLPPPRFIVGAALLGLKISPWFIQAHPLTLRPNPLTVTFLSRRSHSCRQLHILVFLQPVNVGASASFFGWYSVGRDTHNPVFPASLQPCGVFLNWLISFRLSVLFLSLPKLSWKWVKLS